MLIKVYKTALRRFRIFSNLFNSQRVHVGTRTHYKCVNWYCCAMLPWKKVFLIVFRSCSYGYGQISFRTSNAF